MGDDPVATCTECRAPVDRVFRPVAVHFKGSGFYTTDYGRKRSGDAADSGNGDSAKDDSKTATPAKSGSSTTDTSKSDSSGSDSSDSSSGD